MDVMIHSIIPFSRANTLKECLIQKDFFPLPNSNIKWFKMFLYYLLMVIYFIRSSILNAYSLPIVELILCYDRSQPYLYKVSNIAFSLAYLEVFITRIWFYQNCIDNNITEPKFVVILQNLNTFTHKVLLFACKFLGAGVVILVAYIMINIILFHIEINISGSYINYSIQFFWIIIVLYYVRYHVYDMIVVYSTAAGICIVVEKEQIIFTNSIVSFENYEQFEYFIENYKKFTKSILNSRDLIKILNFSNNLTILPFVGIVISQLSLKVTLINYEIVRLITILAGGVYAVRGFIFIAYCSRLHTKSSLVHSKLHTLITRNKCHIYIHRIINEILNDSNSKLSHLIYRDSNDHTIKQLNVLSYLLTTFQFCALVLKFRNQIYGHN